MQSGCKEKHFTSCPIAGKRPVSTLPRLPQGVFDASGDDSLEIRVLRMSSVEWHKDCSPIHTVSMETTDIARRVLLVRPDPAAQPGLCRGLQNLDLLPIVVRSCDEAVDLSGNRGPLRARVV